MARELQLNNNNGIGGPNGERYEAAVEQALNCYSRYCSGEDAIIVRIPKGEAHRHGWGGVPCVKKIFDRALRSMHGTPECPYRLKVFEERGYYTVKII